MEVTLSPERGAGKAFWKGTIMIHRDAGEYIIIIIRAFLGVLFIYASIHKILYPAAFAETVSNYQILPGYLVNIFAVVLPWLEIMVGICLVTGIFLHGATTLAFLMLATFFVALASTFARGLNIDCGCFSQAAGSVSHLTMWWYVSRDGLLTILSAYLTLRIGLM